MSMPQDLKGLLIARIGDDGDVLATNIDALWALYADQGATDARLQLLYTQRDALDLVRAVVRRQVDFEAQSELKVRYSQKVGYLERMRAETQAEIERTERIVAAGLAPASGAITAVAPVAPPDPRTPDANNSRYGGDPYKGLPPARTIV